MSNEFTITAASNSVPLTKRQGNAAYTVFNASGRPITGRAIIETLPEGEAHTAWLKVAGEGERSFAIGAAEQFAVNVNVPDTAPAGNYTFRLKMVDVTNTDEGVSDGPTVTMVVPAPVAGGAKFPIWIIPIIVGVLAVIAVVVFLLTRPKAVTMPNVIGLLEAEAEGTLVASDLEIGRVRDEANNAVAAGLVARTEPEAGVDIEKATRVAIYVSSGPVATVTRKPTDIPTRAPTDVPTRRPTDIPTQIPTIPPTAVPTIDPSVLADYPLIRDGADVTGRSGSLSLQSVSFANGAAYCNGQYDLDNSDGCRIRTPTISGFNFNRFTIDVAFKADELANRPVFVGGRSYRWIGFILKSDGGVRMKYNNSNYVDCTVTYQANRWHSARIVYNQGEAQLYLDGTFGCRVSFTINHGNDANVGVTDYANATLFKGYIRNLKIYNVALASITPDPLPLADYPLARDGAEASNRAENLSLQAVSFVDGAAYCNGQYDFNNNDGCRIRTPKISGFDLDRFTIDVEFKADELANRPVFVGGANYRWIGFILNRDGGVRMKYNNSNYADCSVTYQVNRWHTARITYYQGEARLYLDGTLGCTVSFTINHGNDSNVNVTDYSNATVFKGYIRNLKIYDAVLVP